jgi:gliding motility-associated-like protein
MKKYLFTLILLFVSGFMYSQTYLISQGGTVTTCVGDFFDSGDNGSNYSANENYTMTFHSNNGTLTHIRMDFHQFDVDPSDTLYIYDGSTTASPLIGAYNNVNPLTGLAIEASIYNVSGDLTFKFKSDGVTEAGGWFASEVCIPVCQQVIAAIDPAVFSPMPDDSGYVNICHGDTITFAALGSGIGVFPQNGALYTQDAASSFFIWNFGDGTIDTGQVIDHFYPNVHGYDISLTVIDSHGCTSTNFFFMRVRISGNPIGTINALPNICSQQDTIEITVGYDINNVIQIVPVISNQSTSQSFDSTMFIPDGPICGVQCYNTDVTFTCFTQGQTITSPTDILSVCVDMEHSFGGDLGFTIFCPNGQNVAMAPNLHSGSMPLGICTDGAPYDSDTYPCDPAYNTVGTGWPYCWSEIYSNVGTYNSQCNGVNSPIDSVNQINHTGYFAPNNPFSGLVGCPLNGTWNIQICDDWGQDNGYIFSWTLNLDPSLLVQTGWSYNVPIDSFAWSGNYIIGTTDSSIYVHPAVGGVYSYTMTIFDGYGCTYDTTLSITVVNTPVVDLGPDVAICGSEVVTLDAGNPGATTYLWSTGVSTQTIDVGTPGGMFIADVINTDGGSLQCIDSDTILVTAFPQPVVNLGPDTCSETGIMLDAGPGNNYTYSWSNGDNTQTVNISTTQTISVVVQSGLGSSCFDEDTITVKVIPHPYVELGPDSIICIQRSVALDATQNNESSQYTYYWTPTGETTSTINFSPNGVPGPYYVKVKKTGCTTAMDSVLITGKLCLVTVPNIITPNGDGSNETFVIKGLSDYPQTRVQIFNRWGKKIYESTDYQNDWDGEKYHDGVYYYVITFIDYIDPMTGTITILGKQ